jgi:hypothetical protein
MGKPETFNFLEFTHICSRARRGVFQLKRDTPGQDAGKVASAQKKLRRRMHESIPLQDKWLGQVVRGYFAYHAVPADSRRLGTFRHYVVDLWRRSLVQRSQRDHTRRIGWQHSRQSSYRYRASFIRGPAFVSPSNTRGGSPVRESRPPGSVRGVRSNAHPYRFA